MRLLIFSTIFLSVFAVMNLYVWFRFFRQLELPGYVERGGLIFLIALFALQLFFIAAFRTVHLPGTIWLIVGSAIGFSFMLFTVAVGYDLVRLSADLLLREHFARFRFMFDVTALLVVAGYLVAGVIGGLRSPELRTVRIELDLPATTAAERPLRIVQWSDVHVGHIIRRPFVERLVERTNALDPDLVLITGDLIDLHPERIKDDLAPMANLQSRYGVWFAYGNHEYFHHPELLLPILEQLGVQILDDESAIIHDKDGNEILQLVGVRDLVGQRMGRDELIPDADRAFAKVRADLPVVVLAHQPLWASELIAKGYTPELIVAGHTHGGQIFPFSWLVRLEQPFLAGLYEYAPGAQIYVSRGTGFWGPPIRLFAPSELTLIELVRP